MRLLLSLPLLDVTFYARTYSAVLLITHLFILLHSSFRESQSTSFYLISIHFTVSYFILLFLISFLEYIKNNYTK